MIPIPQIFYRLVSYWLTLSIAPWENITDKDR